MMGMLNDPAWLAVGLGILALLAPFLIYAWQRQTKELAFGLVSSRRLIAIDSNLVGRVTVQLDSKPVEHVRLSVFGLKNSGHQPIEAEDFKNPFVIEFDGNVLSAEVTGERPSALGAVTTIREKQVELAPLLLNPGDQVIIQVLLAAQHENYRYSVRIKGVTVPVSLNTTRLLPPLMQSGMPWAVTLMLAMAAIAQLLNRDLRLSAAFVGMAVYALIYGLISRYWQHLGATARRRIAD